MRLQGSNWLWITTTIIVAVGVCLSPGTLSAYTYEDDFKEDFAESYSYLHSVFWPEGAFPPPEPYLYYSETESGERDLGFVDRHDEPAFLGYRFPPDSEQPRGAVSGTLTVDVRSPFDSGVPSSRSGYLGYSFSADGVNWSTPIELELGSNEIPIASVRGTCHIVFSGTDVLISKLRVELNSSPAMIYVPADYSTIQEAIEHSWDGDIIQVSPGTYRGHGNRDISFRGRAITVRSASGPERTTIDCSGGYGFYFGDREGPDSVLRGFTIKGGRKAGSVIPEETDDWSRSSAHPIGAGIFCEFSSPTIIDCVITDCAAELGGGIGVVGGQPAIMDCVIEFCQAGGLSDQSRGYGAGIGLIRGADASIFNCTIDSNTAYFRSLGAGLYCHQSEAWLVDCDISHNSASAGVNGGGIYCGGTGAGMILEKCLISNNIAEAGGGVFTERFDYARLTNCTIAHNLAGGIHSIDGDIVIRNSIVWYNQGEALSLIDSVSPTPVVFSNIEIEGGYPGQGNIYSEPSFVSPTTGNYHLKSFTGHLNNGEWVMVDSPYDHSPCIDAGDPQNSVGAEPFPHGGRVNMGAYGGTTEASKSFGGVIYHVDVNGGSDHNTGLSRSQAFRAIQHAVDRAFDGDTILVWPGVYRENVNYKSKAITIQSADDAAVISAPGPYYAFKFQGSETSSSVLRNFVIANCGQGAIYLEVASPTLTNLTIADNPYGIVATDGGANPSISNCIFWNNETALYNANPAYWRRRVHFSCLQELRDLDVEYHNISTDPFFANPDNGDYHLQSGYGRYSAIDNDWITDALTSPCIDAGDPDLFPGRERAPHGGIVNMGAYGGTPFASLSGWQSWDNVNSGVQFNPSN